MNKVMLCILDGFGINNKKGIFFNIQKVKGNGKIPLPNLYKIDLIKSTYGNAYV